MRIEDDSSNNFLKSENHFSKSFSTQILAFNISLHPSQFCSCIIIPNLSNDSLDRDTKKERVRARRKRGVSVMFQTSRASKLTQNKRQNDEKRKLENKSIQKLLCIS